jgi:hypothetical protein
MITIQRGGVPAGSRSRRGCFPAFERLDERVLLSGLSVDSKTAPLDVIVAPRVEVTSDPATSEKLEIEAAKKTDKAKLKVVRTFIAGTVIPARLYGDGKGRGALLVADGVAWSLDLSRSIDYPDWAKTLSHRQVVVIGSGEIKRDAKGGLKRTFLVNWMEPLQLLRSPDLLPDPSLVKRLVSIFPRPRP